MPQVHPSTWHAHPARRGALALPQAGDSEEDDEDEEEEDPRIRILDAEEILDLFEARARAAVEVFFKCNSSR